MSFIRPEVIEAIHRELPDVDLFLDREKGVHVIVQKLRGPMPADERLRNVVPDMRNGAPTSRYQFLGYCEITHADGRTEPFIPEAPQIIEAVRRCTMRIADDSGWRELERANEAFDERMEREFMQRCEDRAKEAFIMDGSIGAGRRYCSPGIPMTRNIRG